MSRGENPFAGGLFADSSGKAPVQERGGMSLAPARKEPQKTPVRRWLFIETERRFIGYSSAVYRSMAAVSGNNPRVTQLPFGGKSVHPRRFLEMRRRYVSYPCAVSGDPLRVCELSALCFYKPTGCFQRCGVCFYKPGMGFWKPPVPNDKLPTGFR